MKEQENIVDRLTVRQRKLLRGEISLEDKDEEMEENLSLFFRERGK